MNVFDLEEQVIPAPRAGGECSAHHDRAALVQSTMISVPCVETAINHMLAHLNQPLRISTLSRILGVSKSRFFTLFKSVTGTSPIQYFIKLRMRRACELLSVGDALVKEVAHEMGYDDPFYFSRLFKLVTGLSPANYQKQVGLAPSTCQVRMKSAKGATLKEGQPKARFFAM